MKKRLEIRLLGKFEVTFAGRPLVITSRPTQSLFAYLVLNAGTAHRREKLAGLLWPDSLEETARDNLRHALWRLRKALQSASAASYLQANDLTISFNTSGDYWLDAAALKDLGQNASADELIAVLSEYQGEFLPGFYDEWVALEREHTESIVEHHMTRLMSLLQEEKRWLDILDWGERWIKLGQKPELAYRALMSAHAAKGDMAKVAATYERCIYSLREIGVEPSEQTRALYENLKSEKEILEIRPNIALRQERKVTSKTNLPVPLTSFIGREREIEEMKHLLTATRLLTLAGSGGLGKTRLAIQATNELINDYEDGVWWVDLAALTDPSFVPQTVATALGVREAPNEVLTETLAKHVSTKQMLLAFDNCEHLVNACAQLAERLLSACPNLKVLATSREVLGITGETILRVPALSFPVLTHISQLHNLREFESIQLFVERASAVQQSVALTQENAFAITQICQRLDGIPLAIELAAARVKTLSLKEIAARLNNRFHLLTQGSRTALPRHQTLQAAIDWSYVLLIEPEKILVRRLSVFAGGFTLEAAEVICGGQSLKPNDVLDLLGHLVDKSFVNVEQVNTQSDVRYHILETIREYLIIRLQELNETSVIRDEHLKYFTKWMEEIEPKLVSSEQALWFHRIEMEMDNLRAALDWSMSNIPPYGSTYRKDNAKRLKTIQQLELCYRLGGVLITQAKYTEAEDVYKVMLKCAQDLDDVAAQSRALEGLAFSLVEAGDYQTSLNYALQAEGLARTAGARLELARAIRTQGIVRYRLGEAQAAFVLGEEALSISKEVNDRNEMARSLNLLGASTYILGKYDLAEQYWIDALSTFEDLRNRRQVKVLLSNLGVIADARGDYETAFQRYDGALQIAREIRDRDSEIYMLSNRGGEQVALRNYSAAEADLRKTIEMAGTVGSWALPNTYIYLAEACLGQGKKEDALEMALQALGLALDRNTPEHIGISWRVLGMISDQMGKPVTIKFKKVNQPVKYNARDCFRISEEVLVANGIDGERARTLREWAKYELKLGNKERGAEMWQEARQLFVELGASLEVERMKTLPT